MSCHDIGLGMNEVVRMVITMYDKGELTRENAIKLIATCREAVHWCDGNESEATDYIRNCRCGRCLKMVPKGQKLRSLWELPYSYQNKKSHLLEDARLATDRLCESCFEEVMGEFFSPEEAEEIKKSFNEWEKDGIVKSESDGEMPEKNGCFNWPRAVDWYD